MKYTILTLWLFALLISCKNVQKKDKQNGKFDKTVDLRKPINKNNNVGIEPYKWYFNGAILFILPDGKNLVVNVTDDCTIRNSFEDASRLPKGQFGNLTSIYFYGIEDKKDNLYQEMLGYSRLFNDTVFENKLKLWKGELGKYNQDPIFDYEIKTSNYEVSFDISILGDLSVKEKDDAEMGITITLKNLK